MSERLAFPELAIRLPWPHPDLSPNARVHRQAKARRAKSYRETAHWVCRADSVRKIDADALHAHIVFHPPDKRRRDLDNMLSSIKSGLDGIADAVGVDDHTWTLTVVRGEPVPEGLVLVTLEPPLGRIELVGVIT